MITMMRYGGSASSGPPTRVRSLMQKCELMGGSKPLVHGVAVDRAELR